MDLSEVIEKSRYDYVKLIRPRRQPVVGSLVLTSFHMIFSQPASIGSEDIWVILHKSVDYSSCSRSSNGGGTVCIKCKNFATIDLLFDRQEDGQALANVVNLLSNIDNHQLLYPFFYQPSYTVTENGWQAFTPETEYAKLRIYTDHWRLSTVNTDFQVCPTYPEVVIVPKAIDDDVLRASSRFRDGSRFPVLCYFHPATKSALIRCSQPLVSTGNKRCKQDELLLNSMLVSSNRGYIVDTRCLAAAQSSRSKGGGFEQEVFYPRWKRVHRAVPRRQTVQESLIKLIEVCNDGVGSGSSTGGGTNSDRWLSRIGNTGWLQNVVELLDCACMIAQCIDREGETSEVSVVVHGDEGIDTTLQVVCLVQVLLDSDCRTIRGLESIIEREFVQGGHPFASRCSHSVYGRSGHPSRVRAEGPTFLLFLDCMWQIMQQYQTSFEFTPQLLTFLFDHAYASEFGTFLYNNEKEKKENNVKERTVSLWSYLNQPEVMSQYISPYYQPKNEVLWPSVAPQSIMLWERLYCRWLLDWSNVEKAEKKATDLKVEENRLISRVCKIRRKLGVMQ